MTQSATQPSSSVLAPVGQPAGSPIAAVWGVCLQFVSGVAIFQPFIRLETAAVPPGWVSLMGAALLIGAGMGYLLHFQLLRKWRRGGAIRASAACLSATLILAMLNTDRWNLLLMCVLAGMGLFGEWTAAAGMTRRSLTSTQLWPGMRIYSAAWFAGGIAAALASNLMTADPTLNIGVNGLCVVFCAVVAFTVPRQIVDELYRPASDGQKVDQLAEDRSLQTTREGSTRTETADTCDADECCGGGCEWRPTPLWLGICLATIGMLAAGFLLPVLIVQTETLSAAVLAGALFGTIVFQAVVPGTGYAVLLLSCCVLGMAGFSASLVFDIQWQGIAIAVPATLLAATYCGCSGLIGESFIDARFQNGRSFVLMLGSLAAAVIATLIAGSGPGAFDYALDWGPPGIWLAAIILVRKIPNPVLSQRRQEAISQAEANQILAETPEILEDTVA